MMTQSRFFWGIFPLFLGLWGSHYVYHNKALGFTVAKITSDFSYHAEWDVPCDMAPDLENTLSQPFHYLAAGSQSYAFVSEDGKTVLKFFRMKHQILHLRDWWTRDRSEERKQNLFSIYDAHRLAFQDMKEDAGLLYLHLNKTAHLQKQVKLIDRLGRSHFVNLDDVEFVIQEKAELIFSRMKKFLKDPKKWDEHVLKVMELVQRRIDKGISDHDKAVTHNFGFVGARAIQLDIGRIHQEKKPQDYPRILERIERWRQKNTPPKPSFSLEQISSTLSPKAEWSLPQPSAEEKKSLDLIFNQKFTFLGEGAQAFAFQSEDGKTVLKLFKMRRFTPSIIDQLCPHIVRRRLRNLNWVFNGYKIGYDQFRSQSGLVWIHLAKTDYLHHTITLVDQSGKEHLLDLDTTEFVLQEKAELLFDRLKQLYKAGKTKEAEWAIASILHLIEHRVAKGYADRDKAVSYNYGFVGDKPIHLDLGRLYKGKKDGQLEHVQRRIDRWVEESD